MGRWLSYAAMALVAVGCGGADDDHREDLERALANSGVSYCGFKCTSYDALSAECGDPRRIERRTFYRCTIDYESTEPPAKVCASYDPADPAAPVVRERKRC